MSLLVIGTDGAVAQTLGSAAPLSGVDEAVLAVQELRPDAVASSRCPPAPDRSVRWHRPPSPSSPRARSRWPS